MEFKEVANEMMLKHSIFRDNACENIIDEAERIKEYLDEIILHAKKHKGKKASYLITGIPSDVECVLDKVGRLYRYATELEKEHHLLYELADKMEDIDIQEQSSYNVKG